YVSGLKRSLISLDTLEKEGYTVKMQMGRIKHGGSKQVGFKQLGHKQVWFKQLGSKHVEFKQLGDKQVGFKQLGHNQVGFKQLGPGVETGVHGVQDAKRVWFEMKLQGAQGDREAEVFQVRNDDTAVAQRRLEDKVPSQEGAEGNVTEKKKVKESMEANLGKLLKYNAWSTRLNIEKLDENIVQKHGGSKQVGLKQLGSKQVGFKQLGQKQVGDREAEVFQVSNDDTAVAQRRLEDKQPEEKTNTDCLVKEQEKVHLGIKVGANITVTGVPEQEGEVGNVAGKKKVKESIKANLGKLLKYNA
ncbi:hypothetical protein Tco_0871735, partial [Tanacetum coccineum]